MTLSPLRIGVVGIIVVTVGYSSVHIIPMIRHDLELLHVIEARDQTGIVLEGDLQYETLESGGAFQRALQAGGNASGMEASTLAMRGFDSEIARTESEIERLGAVPGFAPEHFHAKWAQYTELRDRTLKKAPRMGLDSVRTADAEAAASAFLAAEQEIRGSLEAFEAASVSTIRETTKDLNTELRELFALIWIKILVLSLLVWTDWKRHRAEEQLLQATRDLKVSEDRFRQAYESAVVGMGIFKLDGTVLSANAKAAEILGYDVDELIGMKVSDFMAPECVDDHLYRLMTLPGSQENSYSTERRVIRKDGTPAWVRNSVTLLQPEGGEAHYFSISEEITKQHQANARLAYLANYDPITNLPNRHFFEEQLATALQPAAGRADSAALLYLEIDSFDFLKGTFGRNVADEVLGELGATLADFRKEGEVIGRLDDHVFGMLVMAAPYDEATMVRAAELRDIFRRASESGRHRIPLSASIGIAYTSDQLRDPAAMRGTKPGSGSGSGNGFGSGIGAELEIVNRAKAESLMKYARAAMLEARSRGGDSIFVADPSLQERAVQRHQIESALLRGLREDEFRVVFQPQFEVATGRLIRFEALCRWNSAELGPIPPDRFIPIAEQTGLIMEIGRRVIHEALHQAKTWTDSGRRIGVAVNISPMQFMRPDFTQTITEALALSNFPPALLELEITEGIFIRDLNLAVARIRELQRLGLSIALDDFGTGYSSLSYLQRMPIDAVKLDRSFVGDLTTDAATVSMVRSVLAMAEALNLRVVTEGVETQQQLEILRALGCDEAQGYLLGRPESAEMALRRVNASPLHPAGRQSRADVPEGDFVTPGN